MRDSLPRSKAPEAWRTPRRFAFVGAALNFRQVLDCGGPPPLFHGSIAQSAFIFVHPWLTSFALNRPFQTEYRKRAMTISNCELRTARLVRFGVAAFGRKPPSKFRPSLRRSAETPLHWNSECGVCVWSKPPSSRPSPQGEGELSAGQLKIRVAGFAGCTSAKSEARLLFFLPGEKARMRASVKTKFMLPFVPLPMMSLLKGALEF